MASCHTHAAFKLSLYSSAKVRGYGKMYYPPNTKEGCVGRARCPTLLIKQR